MTRHIARCALLLLLAAPILAGPLAAQPLEAAPAAPPVEELVARALERAPALAARRAAVAAARLMEVPAAALPDPMVEGMLQNADFPDYTVGSEDMSMAGVELRQPLPYPGKRRARGEAAAAATALRAAELAAEERRVAAAVRSIYARLYALDRERETLAAARELVELLAATAAARYATGESEQEAVVKAQLQVSRLGEQLDDLAAERAAMGAELDRWLDLPAGAALGDVAALPSPSPPASGWEETALAAAPEVVVAQAAVAAAERRLALARLDLKPDFAPAAGLASRGSLGAVLTLRFGVELPFWRQRKQGPMVRAAEEELEVARQELRDAEAVAGAEAARLGARWLQAERQMLRYREAILPQSSTALDAARSSYLAGRGDFSTVIEDFDLWLQARVQLARREADRFAAWAELERLTGGAP
ncbi:MAG TPA: TolC family protein [Thermoanaerobaculia bacterium]